MKQKKIPILFKNSHIGYSIRLLSVGLILALTSVPVFAEAAKESGVKESQQNRAITVTGTVIDETGEAVIGASAFVKGTTNGTMTDLDGKFTLSNVATNDVISVSYLGYIVQDVKVDGKSHHDIKLVPDAQMLQEVVVGYGAVKRENLLGSVSNISAKEIEDVPTMNLSTALEGRFAGVTIGQSSGSPLASTSIKIRIPGTWNNETPIFVIDGVVYEDQARFDILDPSEIESISVLKDAQAAVYGARAAGGVFVVKTKQGEKGKLRINYSGTYGFSSTKSTPELMNAYDHAVAVNDYWLGEAKWNRETFLNTSVADKVIFTDQDLEYLKNVDHNWLDQVWKTSQQTRHSINLSGGSERFRFFVGGSYNFQDGNFKNLNVNQYTLRSNVEVNITSNWKLSVGLSADNRTRKRFLNGSDKEQEKMYGTYATLLRTPRWVPMYIDGLPVGQGVVSSHPDYIMNETGSYAKSNSGNITANVSMSWDLPWVKGLQASVSGSYNRSNNHSIEYLVPYRLYTFEAQGSMVAPNGNVLQGHILDQNSKVVSVGNPIEDPGKYYNSSSFGESSQINASLNYARVFGDHDVRGMFVFEQSRSSGHNMSGYNLGLSIPGVEATPGFNLDGTQKDTFSGSPSTLGRRMSYIGRVNYGFKSRYLMEAAFRYEGSTKFAPKERWGFFPSVALGWRVSEEPFFSENISPDIFDNLKLRFNWGLLGNDKATSLSWEENYSAQKDVAYIGGENMVGGIIPNNEGIALLGVSWEKTINYNGGIDFRFFKKLNLSIDGYYRHTYDILQNRASSLPYQSGLSTNLPVENYGVQNAWGGEIEIGYSDTFAKDFGYSVKGNMGYATSKVKKKYQALGVIGTWKDEVGRIRGGETGYICTGILTQEDVDRILAEKPDYKIFGLTPEPGMLNFKDVGGENYSNEPDGVINEDDERIISKYDSAPYHYGFSLGFSWKDIRLDAVFSGEFGHDIVYDKAVYSTGEGNRNSFKWLSDKSNNLAMWKDHWTPDNPNASLPRLYQGHADKRSTFWMKDGHVLRMTAINVTYNMPAHISNKFGIPSLRLFFSGTNLWTIVNPYPYREPNLSSWMDYPMLRTFNFGVNLTL